MGEKGHPVAAGSVTLGTSMKPRIILADDHRLVLEALATLLAREFEVVAAVEGGEALVTAVAQWQPDAVLLDLTMPGVSGLEALRVLAPRYPDTRFAVLTMHTDLAYVREAFAAGARGYLAKGMSPEGLIAAVWTLIRGGRVIGPELRIDVESLTDSGPPTRGGSGVLTERQREVVRRVASGMPGKQIASELGISIKTVEFHRACIARQLGLKSTAALTRYAIDHGLVGEAPTSAGRG